MRTGGVEATNGAGERRIQMGAVVCQVERRNASGLSASTRFSGSNLFLELRRINPDRSSAHVSRHFHAANLHSLWRGTHSHYFG